MAKQAGFLPSNYFSLVMYLYFSIALAGPAFAGSNGCGPEGFGFLVPDGPFGPACDKHDICYEDKEVDQVTCDKEFKKNMRAICTGKHSGLQLKTCLKTAEYYHDLVSDQGEMFINMDNHTAGGKVLSVRAKRIHDWLGDDEFEACVTFKNTGTFNTEYDLQLYNSRGKHIDTEPDTYEVNLKVGKVTKLCVGTEGIYPSISDIGKRYKLVLRVDVPQKDFFSNFSNDFLVVDWLSGKTP